MKKRIYKQFVFILSTLVLVLQACVKDKPVTPEKALVNLSGVGKVWVVDEGGYGYSNAEITLYDPGTNAANTGIYAQQNNNAALGDVCQSMLRWNDNYYLVVNHSGKIVVVDASDFAKNATITGFNSPRYLLPISYNKAYVSDLYANSIQVVDLSANSIVGSIPCPGATEQMAMIYNKVFVTNTKSNYTYVINATTNAITDSILVGKGAASLVFDKNDKLWILSGGDQSVSINPKLLRIDPLTLQIELSLPFSSVEKPWRLCTNKNRDVLYYLNNGVCQLPVQNIALPSAPLIAQGSSVFYGLGINPADGNIYVSDAIDYVQKSKIMIYKANGALVTSFTAGIISNGFVFE